MSYPDRPHIQFPFTRGPSGNVNVVEQDTPEHIMSCEYVIVSAPIGYRDDRPEFGWPWPELKNAPLNLGALEQALNQFEPRPRQLTTTQILDAAQAAVRVSIDVGIASTEAN